MSKDIEFTKELGGTLLVIFKGYTYEISRTWIASNIAIKPDKDSPELNYNDSLILIGLYKNSDCFLR
jgi:hypothetical protein